MKNIRTIVENLRFMLHHLFWALHDSFNPRYWLQGFGYRSFDDFTNTVFLMPISVTGAKRLAALSALCGAIPVFVKEHTGLDIVVLLSFFALIVAEFYTGLKVSRVVRGERIKSRKLGRMFLKIGVYVLIISILHAFAKKMEVPQILGYEVNPFMWLYYTFFIGIVFQLFISWMENLGMLGWKETKTLAGFVLRKLNKYFEFDGSKDNGTE